MKAGVRANLDAPSISTISKRDIQRGVLAYVKAQQPFMKGYAKEGMAFMLSWKEEAGPDPVTPAPEVNQSCGFTTPVLKHRVPSALKEQLQADARRHTEVVASPKETGVSPKRDRAVNSKKRGPPQQRVQDSKRARVLQSEDEKRLQERREKKRIKRDIMQPRRPQRQDNSHPPSKPNSKKPNQKLPAGLALMHGFTATNVGKNRLTVDPPFRPGVFSKGRASIQAQVGRSKPRDPRMDRAFSEKQFLKPHGKRRSMSTRSRSSAPQSSEVSSESADDREHLRKNLKADLNDSASTGGTKEPRSAKKGGKEDRSVETVQKAPIVRSRQSPEGARSIVWDIERDSGVLPTDSSSVLVSGSKPCTALLDVTRKKGIPDETQDPAVNERERSNNLNDAAHPSNPIGNQKPPSPALSVRSSESPSQMVPAFDIGARNPEEGLSKYFMSLSLPAERLLDSSGCRGGDTCSTPLDNTAISLPGLRATVLPVLSSDGIPRPSIVVEPEGPTVKSASLLEEDTALCQQDVTDSDWLLSDPIANGLSLDNKECGWFPLVGQLEAQPVPDLALSGDTAFCPLPESSFEYLHSEEEGAPSGFFENDTVPMLDRHLQHENHFLRIQSSLNDVIEGFGTDGFSECSVLASDTFSESIGFSELSELDGVSERPADENSPLLFNEGRYLLLGCRNGSTPTHVPQSDLYSIEADVARHLVRHWMPQKH